MELDESALQSLLEEHGTEVYSVSYDGGGMWHNGIAGVILCLGAYWSYDDNGGFGGPYDDLDDALFDSHIGFGEVDLYINSSELSAKEIAAKLELDCPKGHIVHLNKEEWVMNKDGELIPLLAKKRKGG